MRNFLFGLAALALAFGSVVTANAAPQPGSGTPHAGLAGGGG